MQNKAVGVSPATKVASLDEQHARGKLVSTAPECQIPVVQVPPRNDGRPQWNCCGGETRGKRPIGERDGCGSAEVSCCSATLWSINPYTLNDVVTWGSGLGRTDGVVDGNSAQAAEARGERKRSGGYVH